MRTAVQATSVSNVSMRIEFWVRLRHNNPFNGSLIMRLRTSPRSWIALASCAFATAAAIRISAQTGKAIASTPTAQQIEFFEANIRPVLIETCGECHTDDEKGDLRTDSRAALL